MSERNMTPSSNIPEKWSNTSPWRNATRKPRHTSSTLFKINNQDQSTFLLSFLLHTMCSSTSSHRFCGTGLSSFWVTSSCTWSFWMETNSNWNWGWKFPYLLYSFLTHLWISTVSRLTTSRRRTNTPVYTFGNFSFWFWWLSISLYLLLFPRGIADR